jgi:3-oxoacyl-[acyl-carrier-protein] synthase I
MVTNPTETTFIDSDGCWITAHRVPLKTIWRGSARLACMAATVVEEALARVPSVEWPRIPILLCVAERGRPGRTDGLDDRLLGRIEQLVGTAFAPQSVVVPYGRVAVAVALSQARSLVYEHGFARVLIVATDSLLNWRTVSHYEQQDRLLTPGNSNGFIPGEGAGALLVGKPAGNGSQIVCTGLGFAVEHAHVGTNEPLRGEGLSLAIKAALADAGLEMHQIDFRIADLSGEQFYFKEASLALSRTLRRLKDAFEMWHPAECIGEAGSPGGVVAIAVALAASAKGYAPGQSILVHMSNDDGNRAALTLKYGAP